jgi:ribosome recycling factor
MFAQAEEKMTKILDMFREDIASIRTSRANPALIENINVVVYDGASQFKIKELASIMTDGANGLVIQPWDVATVKTIAKTLEESEIGLSISINGGVVRATLPPLSTQRREEYIKLLKKKLEAARVMIRQIRAEERGLIFAQKEAGKISQDEAFRLEKQLQELTDNKIDKIDQLGDKKIAEIEAV